MAQAVPDITALIPDAHRAAKLHHPSSMIPLAREIDYCHRTLLESLGPDSPLPAHVDGFWQLYAGGQCRGLQRTLCGMLDVRLARWLHEDSVPVTQRLQSSAAPNAGAWLDTIQF